MNPTAYHGGQVSLSPAPHVAREPIGMLVLPLITSFTQGVGHRLGERALRSPMGSSVPATSHAHGRRGAGGQLPYCPCRIRAAQSRVESGVVCCARLRQPRIHRRVGERGPSFFTTLLSVLLVQNVFLAIFNLLPLPPLDGASVLRGLAPRFAGSFDNLSGNPAFSMVGLVVAWQVFPAFTGPIFSMILVAVHPDVGYGG